MKRLGQGHLAFGCGVRAETGVLELQVTTLSSVEGTRRSRGEGQVVFLQPGQGTHLLQGTLTGLLAESALAHGISPVGAPA